MRAQDLGGLRTFASFTHAPVRPLVVFQGDRRERLDDQTEAIPYQEFLLEDLPALARKAGRG